MTVGNIPSMKDTAYIKEAFIVCFPGFVKATFCQLSKLMGYRFDCILSWFEMQTNTTVNYH